MLFSMLAGPRIAGFMTRLLPSASTRQKRFLPLLGLLMLLPQQYALADLMLHPTRVVFEKNQRAAQVELINNSAEAATYRISLVKRRMSETGDFSAIDSPAPGEQFADELLRYSPRQVTVAPGAGQVVRIMLRKPANLAAGEYRSHLQFDKLPDAKGATSIESMGTGDKEIGVHLTALIGASIPVIVRHGETEASVSLSHLELEQPAAGQAPVLALQLQRSGNRSVYGDLTVGFTPQGGDAQVIAKAGGVAVYSPNPLRRAKIALQPPLGVALARGTLRVTYRERPEAGGKLLAEAAMVLP
jgi:P pilus assembly chaperone PapD